MKPTQEPHSQHNLKSENFEMPNYLNKMRKIIKSRHVLPYACPNTTPVQGFVERRQMEMNARKKRRA